MGAGRPVCRFGRCSPELAELAATRDPEALGDEADSSSTVCYEGDEHLCFENGFSLALLAAGRPVFRLETGQNSYGYFVGTLEEVRARLQALPERDNGEPEYEDQDDQDDVGGD